ncbi:MAG: prolyl oligopeptidase family serine peptidase [Hyphomonas sp.]
MAGAVGGGWGRAWRSLAAALVVAALGILGSSPGHAGPAAPGMHRIGIDDVLGLAVFGQAQFSPDGKWLAYNVAPPYDQLTDYSYWLYAFGLSGHQLWVKEVAGNEPPRLQPGLDTEATNYLAGISPDSRWVLVLEHKAGHLRFVGCRIGQDQCVRFDGEPDIRDGYFILFSWNERIEWVSDHAFLMPVRPDDLPGSERHARGLVGETLWRSWTTAWAGKEPTASVMVSTGRDRSEDWATGALMEFELETGAARRLADGRHAGPRVSPDAEFIAAAKVGERARTPADVPLETTRTHPRFDRRYAFRLIDRSSGEIKDVTMPYTVDPGSISWSATGDRVSVFGWGKGEAPADGEYYTFDPVSLSSVRAPHDGLQLADRKLDPEPGRFSGPVAGALLDTGPIAYARPDTGGPYGWYLLKAGGPQLLTEGLDRVSLQLLGADKGHITVLSSDGVFRARPNGMPERLLPILDQGIYAAPYEIVPDHSWSGEFRFASPERRSPESPGARLVLTRDSDGSDRAANFVSMSRSGDSVSAIDLDLPGARLLAASASVPAALVSRRKGSATELLLLRESRAPEVLTRINAGLDHVVPVSDKGFQYTLRDPEGKEPERSIQGCLSLPPDYDPDKRYPVILDIYPVSLPGRCLHVQDMPRPDPLSSDLWTSGGFIYFRPAMPLDLARTEEAPIGGMPDLAAQAATALIDQGYADPDRIVLFGVSQGAVAALYVAARTDKFAAVIAINGWADYLSHYFGARGVATYLHLDQDGGDNRWRYDCKGAGADNRCPFGFGETPFEDPAAYASESPVVLARDIDIPIMLVHSDMDYIAMGQFDEMFGALYRAGKEALYVRYWGEGHGPSSPANIRDLWHRMDGFLMSVGIAPCGEDVCLE